VVDGVNGEWQKSSLSHANGQCVEVMVFDDGSAGVRNSRKPGEGVLHFTPGEWEAFIGGVRLGEFDRFGGAQA
jgi:Domain of unknown function (DUF397)